MDLERDLFREITAEQVADVFSTPDPLDAIRARLRELGEAEKLLADERAKWERLYEAAELIVGAVREARNGAGNAETHARRGGSSEVSAARATVILNERQAAALRLMELSGDRERVWKLKELVEGIVARGFLRDSKWLANQLSKELPMLEPHGLIERPMKGRYKLPPKAAPDGEEREMALEVPTR